MKEKNEQPNFDKFKNRAESRKKTVSMLEFVHDVSNNSFTNTQHNNSTSVHSDLSLSKSSHLDLNFNEMEMAIAQRIGGQYLEIDTPTQFNSNVSSPADDFQESNQETMSPSSKLSILKAREQKLDAPNDSTVSADLFFIRNIRKESGVQPKSAPSTPKANTF